MIEPYSGHPPIVQDLIGRQGTVKCQSMARGSSILLIDDDPESSEVFQLLLTRQGFYVDTAADAASGLACFESKRHQCVVSDLNMKGLTGFDVAATLSKHPGRPMLVALTGDVGPEIAARVRSAGFDHHLAKPIDWPELQAVLSELTASH